MTLGEVAEHVGINKSSAQRMVYTLKAGLSAQAPADAALPAQPAVMEIGFNYLTGNPMIEIANPFLRADHVSTETSCLTEGDGSDMVYVARFVSAQFVPVHMPIGSRIPMYCTARAAPT
jgi:DNA-binding IclR family transcriptional regulator